MTDSAYGDMIIELTKRAASCAEPMKKLNEQMKAFQEQIKDKVEIQTSGQTLYYSQLLSRCSEREWFIPYFENVEVIPEVKQLAETTPHSYFEILRVCEWYGVGYKEIIQKHIDAGTTHEALNEMTLEIRLRLVAASFK